jgi:hypothetical protein
MGVGGYTYLHFQKNGETRSESFSTRPESNSTHNLLKVGQSTQQLLQEQEDLVD